MWAQICKDNEPERLCLQAATGIFQRLHCRDTVTTIRNQLADESLRFGECRPKAAFDYPEHVSTERQGFIRVYTGFK
jgi:hypothetical protein